MKKQDILENQVNEVYLGLGSNLGNKINNINKALYLISDKNTRIVKISSHYESLSWPKKSFPNYEKKSNQLLENNYQRVEVSGIWSKSMLSLSFDENEIERISSLNLDCIIRCGTGILRGKILNITRYGILSFCT